MKEKELRRKLEVAVQYIDGHLYRVNKIITSHDMEDRIREIERLFVAISGFAWEARQQIQLHTGALELAAEQNFPEMELFRYHDPS